MRIKLIFWLLLPSFGLFFVLSYFIRGTEGKENLEGQIQAAEAQGFDKDAVREKMLKTFDWKGEGVVTLWFDDAWRSQYEVAFTGLQKQNIKGALAVTTLSVGKKDYMGWWQIERMQFYGWEITSHTRGHSCEEEKLDHDTLEYEILGAKLDLVKRKIYAENFVTPCGVVTAEVTEEVKQSYSSLRGSGEGLNPIPVNNQYNLNAYVLNNKTTPADVRRYLNKAKEEKGWLILAFHQIDLTNQEYSISPQLFNEMIIEVRKSGLQIALPTQVLSI